MNLFMSLVDEILRLQINLIFAKKGSFWSVNSSFIPRFSLFDGIKKKLFRNKFSRTF